MKAACYLMLLVSLVSTGGCCEEVHFTPQRPTSVRGWHEFNEQGAHVIGEFVLNKGEDVDNGRLGVELVKIIPRKRCHDLSAENDTIPRALMKFYRAKDHQPIGEIEVTKGASSRLVNYNIPVDGYGVDAVFVREINTKDEWIWFELLK